MADPIQTALNSPYKRATTGAGTVEQFSGQELIALDQYGAAKQAAAKGFTMGGSRGVQGVAPPQCNAGIGLNLDAGGGDGSF